MGTALTIYLQFSMAVESADNITCYLNPELQCRANRPTDPLEDIKLSAGQIFSVTSGSTAITSATVSSTV